MPAPLAANAAPAFAGRAGYDPDGEATARRVLPMLARDRVLWLSTIGRDGRPHLVPTWFWWDGEALLVWSRADAVKVRNLRADPRLMVAVGDPGADFSVGLIEASAVLVDRPIPDGFFAKYEGGLARAGLDRATFRAQYTQAIRVMPTRFLAWHGRGARHAPRAGRPGGPATRGPGPAAALAEWVAARLERSAALIRAMALGRATAPAS